MQSIEVAKVAKNAKAHTVVTRIHSLILQKFTSGTIEDPDGDHDEQMVDEEEDEDAENPDEGSTDDEEMFDEDDGSSVNSQLTYSNTTSVCTSVDTSDQAVYPRQEHSSQVKVGTGQEMTTEKPVALHLASAFVDRQTNGMYPSTNL